MPRGIQQSVDRFYDSLVLELDRFLPGDRFLSIRELIQTYKVSRRVVDKALTRLKREKQIQVEPMRGIYVRERARNTRVVTSVHCDWPAEYWKNLDAEIEKGIRIHSNWYYTSSFFEPNSGERYLDQLKKIHGDAILFTFPIHRFSSREIVEILSLRTPIIFLEDNLLCDGINALGNEPELSGALAAECLIRNGHRKLAMILSEPWSIGDVRRNTGFLTYARLHGLEPLEIDCEVSGGEASCAKAHDKMLEYFRAHGLTFTGCYTMSDYSALGVISAALEYGLQVPEDISIIGQGGIPSSGHYNPPLTTIFKDPQAISAEIVRGLEELFSGGSFGIRNVPGKLIERASVRNLNTLRREEK